MLLCCCIDRICNESCENELHVHTWSLKTLKPSNNANVKNMMLDPNEEIESGIDGMNG
jgi:hypothetical protein